jgi:hypothetical protein
MNQNLLKKSLLVQILILKRVMNNFYQLSNLAGNIHGQNIKDYLGSTLPGAFIFIYLNNILFINVSFFNDQLHVI